MKWGVSQSLVTSERTPVDEWCALARSADDAGADCIGFADALTRNFELTVGLTLLATATTRARIVSTVTNPVARHPAVVAAAFASLQLVSGGRMALGISTGDSGVRNLGADPARLEDVTEFIRTFRELLQRGESVYRGRTCRLPWAPEEVAPVPVFMAARGKRSLDLAGRIADGVLTGQGLTASIVAETLERIDRGSQAAGRQRPEVWFHAPVCIDADRDAAEAAVLGDVVGAARMPGWCPALEESSDPRTRAGIARIREEYNLAGHMAVGGENARLVDSLELRRYLVDTFAVVGGRDEVAARLRELESRGVERLFVTTSSMPDPDETFAALQEIALAAPIALPN